MRTELRCFALAGVLLAAGSATVPPLPAQTSLEPGSWYGVFWTDGEFDGIADYRNPGDLFEPAGFFLAAVERVRLRVTDAAFIGDLFDLFVNDVLLASSSAASAGGDTGAMDGDAAWADTRLSRLDLFLHPGDYRIDFVVHDQGFGGGELFVRADLAAATSTVPEPAVLLLLGSGLAGLTVARRKRERSRG